MNKKHERNWLRGANRYFSEDIGIVFGIQKCVGMAIKKGKLIHSVGIELTDENKITGGWK